MSYYLFQCCLIVQNAASVTNAFSSRSCRSIRVTHLKWTTLRPPTHSPMTESVFSFICDYWIMFMYKCVLQNNTWSQLSSWDLSWLEKPLQPFNFSQWCGISNRILHANNIYKEMHYIRTSAYMNNTLTQYIWVVFIQQKQITLIKSSDDFWTFYLSWKKKKKHNTFHINIIK